MRDQTLVLGLALRGVVPGSHLIISDDVMWRWVILLLVCAQTCCARLMAETPLGAWFYRWTQASNVVGLDRVEVADGRRPIGVDNLMVLQEDVAG
jgi:hypothetical protein